MNNENRDLVLQFLPLAFKLAYDRKKSLPKSFDIEDLQSAAFLGLCEAASKYDPLKGRFSVFAYRHISWAILDHVRWGYQNNIPICELTDHETYDIEESFGDFINILDKRTREIFVNYFVENMTLLEIGQKLDLTESRVSQIIRDGKERIKCKYFDLLAA